MKQSKEASRILLIGTRLAPPVELMRWLYEVHNIAYRERSYAPAFHAFASWRRGVPIELPLLVTPQGAIGGLRNALVAFDQASPPGQRLFGETESERAANLVLFDELERLLFNPAVQMYYSFMLAVPDVMMRGALDRVPAWQAAFVRYLYPLWRSVMRKGLKLGDFDLAAARTAIDAAFARTVARLDEQAPYLGGDRPNGMDIVFAALTSPILLPENHGAAVAARLNELPEEFRALVEAYRASPGGQLALRIYQTRPKR